MNTLQDYQHEPLLAPDGLRILVLDPAGDSSAILQGSIIQIRRFEEIAKAHNQQRYSAVSYTWGEPNFCEDLLIHRTDDSTLSFRLTITPNVNSMLSHLRKAYKPRYLWIDAICLNQADNLEKSQQIPLMGEIYSQADKVHIWLGPDGSDDIGRVFSFLRLVAHSPEPVDIDNMSLTVFGHVDLSTAQVGRFFERPWFFRRWILQEAALGKYGIVHCGAYRIAYPVFTEACRRLQTTVHGRNKYAIETTTAIAKDRNTRDIFDLLWLFHKSSCYERRDRIMALYGFLPRQNQLPLDSSTTHVDVYQEHATWLLENRREHEMFLHLFHFGPLPVQPDSVKPGLCASSWIPDWSSQRDHAIPLVTGVPTPSIYNFKRSMLATEASLSALFQNRQDQRQPLDQIRSFSAWRGFLFSPMSPTSASRTKGNAPYTLFASDQDEAGRSVLNVRWINPWAGAYGRSVKHVVTIPKLPNTWKDVAGSFDNFFGRKSKEGLLETDLDHLSLLIEPLMSQKDCHSLHHWDKIDRPVVVKQAVTLLATGAYKEPSLLCQYVDMSKSGLTLLETIESIILDLGIVMHQCHWAIVEIEPVQFGVGKNNSPRNIEYAFGPSTINQSTLLIPMASRLPGTDLEPGRVMWDEEIPGHRLKPRELWGPRTGQLAAFTTLIAVQPLNPSFRNPHLIAGILARNDKFISKTSWAAIVSGFSPPVQTKYLGSCLAIVGANDHGIKDFETSPLNSTGWGWWGCMAETYFDVKLKGLPIPFTIDIV